MSVNTVVFSRFLSPASVRNAVRFCVAGGLAVTLSACSGGFGFLSPSITPLPSLSDQQLYRDHLARVEAAIAWRATEFAAKATLCEECRAVASSIAEDATKRLEDMGGLWQPWPADLPQSAAVERPLPVADAPTTPEEFVAWLRQLAYRDAFFAASGKVSVDERPAFIVSAATRLFDAQRLARAFSLSLDPVVPSASDQSDSGAQSAEVTQGTSSAFEGDDTLLSWSRWETLGTTARLDAVPVPDIASVSLEGSSEAAQAVQLWDCAAQLLPGLGEEGDALNFANAQSNALLTRSTQLLTAGAPDSRVLRCQSSDASLNQIARRVIEGDMALLMGENNQVHAWALSVLEGDLATWVDHLTNEDLSNMLEATPNEAESN